jgi:hypothetical protein
MMVDWRGMFKKYMRIVGEQEGVDFINPEDWTDEEMAEINVLDKEIFDDYQRKDHE